jgi:hypothetical protein
MQSTTVILTLNSTTCADRRCGVVFGLSAEYEKMRRRDHAVFYCPNGHVLSFHEMTDAERLRRDLTRAQDRMATVERQLKSTEMRRRVTLGALNKAKARIAAGICPACDATFSDLEHHMSTAHPAFTTTPTSED